MIEMAPKRQRDARRNATVDVFPSTERFDAAGRSRFGVRRMWSICPATSSRRLENRKVFYAFASRIQTDGLTPFRPD
jgi:hypothetical protein